MLVSPIPTHSDLILKQGWAEGILGRSTSRSQAELWQISESHHKESSSLAREIPSLPMAFRVSLDVFQPAFLGFDVFTIY